MKIELENIHLTLGGKSILNDVSFSVDDGTFVSVLGESGAGKSTTLKVISGLLLQNSGQVLFDGQCVDEMPTYKRHTSIVFQDIRLFPNMNVLENVAFPLKMQGVKRTERLTRAAEYLASVHLEDLGSRKPYELSGGQQQRVALARALAASPQALLLDEPFSGLDEQLRDEMRKLVLELHETYKMTSLMVTHDCDEALVMSHKIVYMSDGHVIQVGSPAELLMHPVNDVVASAFEAASTIEGEVVDGKFVRGTLELDAEGFAEGPAALVRVPNKKPFIHVFEN